LTSWLLGVHGGASGALPGGRVLLGLEERLLLMVGMTLALAAAAAAAEVESAAALALLVLLLHADPPRNPPPLLVLQLQVHSGLDCSSSVASWRPSWAMLEPPPGRNSSAMICCLAQ
jgi:hypothetical protein